MKAKKFPIDLLEKSTADMINNYSIKKFLYLNLIFVTVLFFIFIYYWYFQPEIKFDSNYYLTAHTLLESFSILVSIMVFSVGWHSYQKEQASNIIFVSSAFLAVGLIDFAHALSYQGMPPFFTSNNPEKSINFWLIARFIAGIAIMSMVIVPWKPFKFSGSRYIYLIASIGFTLFAYWIGLFYPNIFPATFVEGEGLTSFKIGAEFLIISIYVMAGIILWLRSRHPLEYDAGNLMVAVFILALSEACFTLYSDITDTYSLLGHIYKAIAYIYIYRAIIVDNVQQPILRMRSSEKILKQNQNWFNTTLTSIYDAVITTDIKGKVTFMNPAAEKLTGWYLKEACGQDIKRIFHMDNTKLLEIVADKEINNGSFHEALLETRFGFSIPIYFSVAPIKYKEHSLGSVIVFRDVTKQKEAEKTHSRQIALLETTTDFVATADGKGRALYYNRAARKMLGINETEDISQIRIEDTHPVWASAIVINEGLPMAAEKGVWSGETAFLSRKGKEIPVSQVIIAHKNKEGVVEYYSTIARDISQIKQAEEKQLLAGKVLENITECVIVTDANNNIQSINPAFTRVTGYSEEDVTGKNPRILSSGRHNSEFYQNMWKTIHEKGRWKGEIWNKRKNGEIYLEGITISTVKDEQGKVTHYVGVMKDITLQKKLEQKIQHQAFHDNLTNLPNRVLLYDRLQQGILRARRNHKKLAVMFLDLDRFKRINDTLGHSTGDQLLKAVAERLTNCVRDSDTVARQGGDEFIILLPEIDKLGDAAQVAKKIIETLKKPFFLENHELFITTSIGISIYPTDGTNQETLIRHADTAMYRAKEHGRNNYQFFTLEENETFFERLTLETHLRKALVNDEFLIYYQPRVDLRSGRIRGMEALVRWKHPEMGIISPDTFIPIAEETGLIIPLGEWVLRQACQQNKKWQESGLPNLRVAVNLSMLQFKQKDLAELIQAVLSETGLDSQYLELELTESIIMNNPDVTLNTLNKLKKMGIQISLDDFGTGYSSLNYLKRFPIDTLKIDKSFIKDVTVNQDDKAIVIAMINLAHSLHLRVVAEGVETEEQLAFLHSKNCDEIQGYFCSSPLPAKDFSHLILGQDGKMNCHETK